MEGNAKRVRAANGRSGGWRLRRVLFGVGVLAGACWQEADATPFKVAEAVDAQRWISPERREPLLIGQSAAAPWRVVTGDGGRLLLLGGGSRVQFMGRCDTELEADSRPLEGQQVHTFLKPLNNGSGGRASDTVFSLREGTLLAEIGERPFSLSCPHLQIDARRAVFAITSTPSLGALLSVLEGQIKVRTADRSVVFVGAGKSLRVASGIPARLGLLDESPEGQEHRRGLIRLTGSEATSPGGLVEQTPESVGTGGEAPFDISRRRRAALLTAPSPDQIGLPEVSPELPQTPTLKP